MTWDDIGFLLSKNKYSENSLICEIFTKDHGKVSGIIFGGTSRKIKNYLQIGNQIYTSFNSKSEGRIGYFKVEIEKALSPLYFDNPRKLSCINSAMQLIKILTADSQKNINIYDLILNFYNILEDANWIKNYIFWELKLFKEVGFDLELSNLVIKENSGKKFKYVTKSSIEKKTIPNFLIEKDDKIDNFKDILDGLKLVGDYLDKTILKPNNLTQPSGRLQFINSLK